MGGEDQAVVRASDDLTVTADDLLQLKVVTRSLVVLGDGEIRDLFHLGAVDVPDGPKSPWHKGSLHIGSHFHQSADGTISPWQPLHKGSHFHQSAVPFHDERERERC